MFAAMFSAAVALCALLRPDAAVLAVGAGLAVLSVVAFCLRSRLCRRVAICCLGLCAGLFWYAGYEAVLLRPALQADGQTVPLCAVARSAPSPTRYGSSVEAEITLEGRHYRAAVYLREDEPDILPGDRICCQAELALTNADVGADSIYYRARGVVLVAKARSAAAITRAQRMRLRDLPAYAAYAVRQKIAALFPADTKGFVAALLTGQRDGLDYETKNALSLAGIYHTVAVSGMHVSILLGIILLLCASRRRLAAAIGVPVVVFFVLMTGASASAVRAGCMQVFLLLAPLAGRENDLPTSISVALMLLLAQNPWAAMDAGLQLSFASVAGIVLFSGRLYGLAAGWHGLARLLQRKSPFTAMLRVMLTSAACSLAATVFSLPLSAAYFGVVPLLAPLSNALCLWAVTLVFAFGLVVCLAGFVLGELMLGPAWLLGWLVRYILAVARGSAGIPGAALYLENGYMWALGVLAYVAAVLFAVRPKLAASRLAAACLLLAFGVGMALSYLDYRLPAFVFTALDVGQGQCLIYSSRGRTCVIDCGGTEDESGECAARFLQSYGQTRIEALVLTHYDADHVNGVIQLLRRVDVQTLYLPEPSEEPALRAAIEQQAAQAGCETVYVHEDTELTLGDAQIQIFAPVSDDSDNDCGLSVLASCEEYDILITGDMTEKAEWRLMSLHELPELSLLVAGHHGAKSSTGSALLAKTRPEAVLISAGEDNPFGHPADETLARIALAGAAVYRTDEQGTITIRGGHSGKSN